MLVLCLCWGMQQAAVKVAVAQGLPPLLQAGLRSAIAAALVCLWIALRQGREGMRTLLRRDASLAPGLLVGVLFAAEFTALFAGVARTSASRAVLLLYTAPFFTVLGAHLTIPGERLRPVQGGGLLLAFAGVAVTVGDPPGGSDLRGDALVTCAAALWGALTVTVKRSRHLAACPAGRVLLYQLGGSAPLLLLVAAAFGQVRGVPHASRLAWAALAYQTVFVAFASYLAWFWMIARYPAGRLSAFTLFTPLFGIAAGILLLGEPARPSLLLALALVAAGLVLVNREAGGRQARAEMDVLVPLAGGGEIGPTGREP